jgi:hypothetical protein
MTLQAARTLAHTVASPLAISEEHIALWAAAYRGAFMALGVTNSAMARELAYRTRSDDEVAGAIDVMRAAAPGDRVWPALNWLRVKRVGE